MSLTIREIAQRAGVSKAAVSYVLNGRPGVSEATRNRILAIVEETGYRPNPVARGLARQRTDMLGLIVPDISDMFYAHIIRSVERKASAHNFTLLLCTTRSDKNKERQVIGMMTSGSVDGVLLMTYHLTPTDFQHLHGRRTPFVIMGDSSVPDNLYSVSVDNRDVGMQATNYLLNMGHRDVAYIHGSEQSRDTWMRFDGYKATLAKRGHSLRPEFVQYGDFQRSGGYAAARRLLALCPRPTAIFAGNDQMALGALRAVQEAGLRVPQDISIIGVDDIDDASMSNPPLTTVRQPVAEMGAKAVELLIDQVHGKQPAPCSYSLKGTLVERGTVARAAGR